MTIKTKIFITSQKWHFSKGVNPCFWSKNANFFTTFFSLKIKLEVRVNNVLDSKKTFLSIKKEIFHSVKNGIFPKGLTHAFGPKNATFFPFLCSVKTKLEIVLTDFVDKKETFFDY